LEPFRVLVRELRIDLLFGFNNYEALMSKQRRNFKETKKTFISPFKDYWGSKNYYVLYIGLGVLLIGFFLLAQGPWDNPLSRSVSPVVLLIAYFIIIPLSIFIPKSKKTNKENSVPSKS
jgi:hypothetical protein